ncbi:MAG: hypothetical protein CMI16_02745 [Opitutaceae bacterium]|nr:hypothetical protein [Opitutaceae bacterium]
MFARSLSDCGWRSPPRSHNQRVARSNDCKINGFKSTLDQTNAAQLALFNTCLDFSDYYAPREESILELERVVTGDRTTVSASVFSCGRGTDTDICGEKPIYIAPDAPGGCQETCDLTLLRAFLDPADFNKFQTCSDGGEGSFRIRFKMPRQTVYKWEKIGDKGQFTTEFADARHFQTGMLTSDVPAGGHNGERAMPQWLRDQAANNASNYYYWDFACKPPPPRWPGTVHRAILTLLCMRFQAPTDHKYALIIEHFLDCSLAQHNLELVAVVLVGRLSRSPANCGWLAVPRLRPPGAQQPARGRGRDCQTDRATIHRLRRGGGR